MKSVLIVLVAFATLTLAQNVTNSTVPVESQSSVGQMDTQKVISIVLGVALALSEILSLVPQKYIQSSGILHLIWNIVNGLVAFANNGGLAALKPGTPLLTGAILPEVANAVKTATAASPPAAPASVASKT